MVGAYVWLWLAMAVHGTGGCPTAGDVEAKLAPLLPPGFAGSSADQASIVEDGDGNVTVSLARPDGLFIGQRRLPRAATCVEQAETVAVTLAVWEAQVHPEIALKLDRLATPPPAPPAPTPPLKTEGVVQRGEPVAPRRPTTLAVGAAALGSWQSNSLAPGGRIDATWRSDAQPWRARLSLAGVGKHTVDLSPGQAGWWRLYAALGADYVLPFASRWSVALGAAGVVAATTIEGSGFAINHTASALDLGAETILRLDVRLAVVRPWAGVGLLTWFRRQSLSVTGISPSRELPRLEPVIALGADFCWAP